MRLAHIRWTYIRGIYQRPGGTLHLSAGLGTTFVPFRFLVVVQHAPQCAPWPGARSSTLRASSKSFSVTAPPALWVCTDRATVS